MKKLSVILRLSLCVFVTAITGCETDKIIFGGPYFVRFTEDGAFDKESSTEEKEIELHHGGPALEEDIVITYSVGGTARLGIDYEILDDEKKVIIPAGAYFGNIHIRLINNANNILRSQTIVLTILATNIDGLEVGQGVSSIGKTYTFTIFDDCILGGTYSGQRSDGNNTYTDLSVTSTDCINYVLSNWNLDVFTSSVTMDLKFVDNGDNTITVPQQEEEELTTELATIKGTGVVDPTTKQILLTITLVDFEDQPQASIILNPQ